MEYQKVVSLGVGDMRTANFIEELYEFLCEKAEGFPVPSLIGALEIVKMYVYEDARDE
jgi:hypothetical protein